MTSKERVKTLLDGQLPDRPPLYDVIRNDAILEHFGGAKLTPETAKETVIKAHSMALDATKAWYRLPEFEPGRKELGADGRVTVSLAAIEDYIKNQGMTLVL